MNGPGPTLAVVLLVTLSMGFLSRENKHGKKLKINDEEPSRQDEQSMRKWWQMQAPRSQRDSTGVVEAEPTQGRRGGKKSKSARLPSNTAAENPPLSRASTLSSTDEDYLRTQQANTSAGLAASGSLPPRRSTRDLLGAGSGPVSREPTTYSGPSLTREQLAELEGAFSPTMVIVQRTSAPRLTRQQLDELTGAFAPVRIPSQPVNRWTGRNGGSG